MRSTVIVLAGLLVAGRVCAQDYFPLTDGATWMYESADGASTDLVVVDGMAPVIGGVAVVRHSVYSGADAQEVFNFWTRDAAGRVLLHGAYNPSGFVAYYDPPIVWLDVPPLNVGDQWCSEFYWHDSVSDPAPAGPYTICYTVTGAETITVPAGTFAAIGVDETLLLRGGYNLLGERATGAARTADWYAENVGQIRFSLGWTVYDLLEYNHSVGVDTTTWSEVKALFE
jgi:hypothetical protein